MAATTPDLRTFLFTDIEGSSLLWLDHRATMQEAVAAHDQVMREVSTRHGGEVFKTAGDAFYIIFRRPSDAVLAACEAQVALAAQVWPPMGSLKTRAAIHVGTAEPRGGDYFGPALNRCARLLALAHGGQVLVTAAVTELLASEREVRAPLRRLGYYPLDDPKQNVGVCQVVIDGLPQDFPPLRSPGSPGADEEGVSIAGLESVPPAQRPGRSIAVMPFEDLSRDPDQDDLADAFMRAIAAELTRHRELFVIAPGASLSLKGKTLSPQAVAREFGVNYVLEGSILRSRRRVRITVSLIDGADGAQLWADRFDHTWEDAFELQDRVALEVGGNVAHQLMRVMMRRAVDGRAAVSPSAEELMGLAMTEYLRFQAGSLRRAVELFDEAAALNPRIAMALAFSASARTQLITNGWTGDPETDKRVALGQCDKAAAAGADSARVLAQVGLTLVSLGANGSQAEALSKQALAISPHDYIVLMMTASVALHRGELDVAEERALQALQFAPTEDASGPRAVLAVCRLLQRRFEEALELLRQNTRELPVHVATAASAYGHLGMAAEAHEALGRFRAVVQIPIERHAMWVFQKPEHRALFLEGIAKAEAFARDR